MDVLKKILNIIIDIFIVVVVIVSAAIAIISLSSQEDGVPKIFGYVPLSVQSNSMSPTFEEGDMIVGKNIDKNYDFQAGDVITYKMVVADDEGNSHVVLNTHRIVEVTKNPTDLPALKTRGDNNEADDHTLVITTDVVALWSAGNEKGIVLPKLGSVLEFLRKPSGFFIAVVIPMIIFFIYELIRFITNFMNYNKEKQKEAALQAAKELMGGSSSDSSGLSEDQKAQAILEYLEKQKSGQGATPPALEAVQEQPAAPEAEAEAEQPQPEAEEAPVEESESVEETEQPATAQNTEAVSEPEQETEVSDTQED